MGLKRNIRISFHILLICLCSISLLEAEEAKEKEESITPQDHINTRICFSYFIQPITYIGINDEYDDYHNTFSIKRARADTRIQIGKAICGRIQGDLTRSPALIDAYVDLTICDNFSFRMGKYKSPLSMERAQPVPSLLFSDFAFTASLVPNRDIGMGLHWKFFHQIFDLDLACMNGPNSGAECTGDTKDWIAHLGVSPFAFDKEKYNYTLVIAAGVMIGDRKGDVLPTLKTPAGTKIFQYNTAVNGQGKISYFSPQIKFIERHIYVLAEGMFADYGIADSTDETFRVQDMAWNVSAGYLIFGGIRDEKGMKLNKDAKLSNGGKGALEFVSRIQGYHVDETIFERFASSSISARKIMSLQTGLQWYYADNSCIRLIYARSTFQGAAVSGNRHAENTIVLSINLIGKL